MRSFPQHLNNKNGSTVISMLSVVIVIGVLLETTGFGDIIENNLFFSKVRAKEARDLISYRLEKYASLPITIRNSLAAPENSNLRNCVLGTTALACLADGTEYPLSLYSPSSPGSSSLLIAGPGPVTGSSQPVLYDLKGNICQTGTLVATATCPFEVSATFTAKCPVASGSLCTTADSISVHYTVQTPASLTSASGGGRHLILAAISNAASSVQIKDILPPAYGYVPGNIITSSLIASGISSTLVTLNTPISSYDQVLAVIQQAIGGDAIMAKAIADYVYTKNSITDVSLITALAVFWKQNMAAAQGAADWVEWSLSVGETVNATEVDNIAKATAWISDPMIGYQLAYADQTDITDAKAIVNALAGVTNYQVIQVAAELQISNFTLIQSLTTAYATLGYSTYEWAYPLAEWADSTNTTDVAALITYASSSTYQPVVEAPPGPTANATGGGGTTTSVSSTSATPAPSSGSLTSACTTNTSCGTSWGL